VAGPSRRLPDRDRQPQAELLRHNLPWHRRLRLPRQRLLHRLLGRKQCWPAAGKKLPDLHGLHPRLQEELPPTPPTAPTSRTRSASLAGGLCVARTQSWPLRPGLRQRRNHICVDACSSHVRRLHRHRAQTCACVNRACEPSASARRPRPPAPVPRTRRANLMTARPTRSARSIRPDLRHLRCPSAAPTRSARAAAASAPPPPYGRRKPEQPGCRVAATARSTRPASSPAASTTGTCQGTPGATCQTDAVCRSAEPATSRPTAARSGAWPPTASAAPAAHVRLTAARATADARGRHPALRPALPAQRLPRGFVCNDLLRQRHLPGLLK